MPAYVYILLSLAVPLAIIALFMALGICFKFGLLDPRLHRTDAEVAQSLRSFLQGGSHPHQVDDFECIPIKDARLDAVRERFVRLAQEFPTWIGEGPFPVEGRERLESLIEEAESATR